MKPVHTNTPASTNVTQLDWHHDGRLVATFKGGQSYTYAGVPEAEYHRLVKADSVGGHLAQHIKNHYAVTKN